MHSTHQPSPSQSALVRSSLCIPPTGNPPLQSVRVCTTSASATTVHCVFHLPQSELVLSISTPVNENHLCSPHNRQLDRNQCLWIPWCAFHYVLPFCSFCLPAITPMQSVPVKPQFKVCSTCRPSPSCASYFCTSEQKSLCIPSISRHHCNQCLCSILFVLPAGNYPNAISACVSYALIRNHNSKCAPFVGHHRVALSFSAPVNKKSLCIPPVSHHHRNQRLCVPVCAFHPPAIHRCNQCVCVQHLRQQPQFTVGSTCHNQNLCFLFLYQ